MTTFKEYMGTVVEVQIGGRAFGVGGEHKPIPVPHVIELVIPQRQGPQPFVERDPVQGVEIRGLSWGPDKHHTVTPEQVRTFRPDVCCEHEWQTDDWGVYGSERCPKCGATCTRGRDGQIEEYAAAPC